MVADHHRRSPRRRRFPRPGRTASVILGLAALGVILALTAQQITGTGAATAVESKPERSGTAAALFQALGFRLDRQGEDGGTVPRIFLPAFPDQMAELPEGPERKGVFIAALLPHVLKVNELIAADRRRLLDLRAKVARGGAPSERESAWARAIARHYGLDAADMSADMTELLLRVQVVPPSLALTQAAIESGWGGSRFAIQGNAAFGQRTWDGEGLIPARRRPGESHRIRNFDHLFQSVASYMHNLNTHPAYAEMRAARAALDEAGQPLTGAALAPALVNYSERREAYVADMLAIMADNNLDRADRLRLAHAAR